MAICHQCKAVVSEHTRDGACSICFKTDATFCATCAMWELGPNETDEDLFPGLLVDPRRRSLSVQRQHSESSQDDNSSSAEVELDCDVFLAAMADVCPYIKTQLDESIAGPQPFTEDKPTKGQTESETDYKNRVDQWEQRRSDVVDDDIKAQLYAKTFKTYVCSVLDKFRELYATCKYDRLAIQVLLTMHLSSQERVQCRWYADKQGDSVRKDVKFLKRWQARAIAVVHTRQHLDAIGEQFGDTVKDAVGKDTYLKALGFDHFELFMKGLKSPTLMAIDLLALAGGDADKAREILEISIILYHALTATRPKGELDNHWSQRVLLADFAPWSAMGFLRKAHFEEIYGATGDGKSFDAAVKDKLNQLHAVLDDDAPENTLPSHPRFRDDAVLGNGKLRDVEKHYLCYLPTFDTPDDHADQRSECEKVVRRRVVDATKLFRDEFLKATKLQRIIVSLNKTSVDGKSGGTKYIRLDCPGRTRVSLTFTKDPHASDVRDYLDATAQQGVRTFVNSLRDPTWLSTQVFAIVVTMTHERGNTRRDTRRDNVEAAIWNEIPDLDESGNRYLQYSRDPTVVADDGTVQDWDTEEYVDKMLVWMRDHFYVDQAFGEYPAKKLLTETDFAPKAWMPLKLVAKRYATIFPDCQFDDQTGPELDVLDEHYEPWTGDSPRPSHYVDWRNHKDVWLYDCFGVEPRRRPLFCSLSGQPVVPEPNTNYGNHTLLLSRAKTRIRSIHTYGDKHQPRRSMLLLLDDMLYKKPKKDKSGVTADSTRHKSLDDMFKRFDVLDAYNNNPPALADQWIATLAVKKTTYSVGDGLIECQIFGGVDMTDEMLGLITLKAELTWATDNPKKTCVTDETVAQQHLNTNYGGGKLLTYGFARTISANAPPTNTKITAIQTILNKQASDHTDT
jgi:hypothetical protein